MTQWVDRVPFAFFFSLFGHWGNYFQKKILSVDGEIRTHDSEDQGPADDAKYQDFSGGASLVDNW